MFSKSIFYSLFFLATPMVVFAQTTAAPVDQQTEETRIVVPVGVTAPTFGAFKVSASIKSWNTSGRGYELSTANARRYKLKNEYALGTTHLSGWGLSGLAVTNGTSFGDSTKDHYGAGDPSLTLIHPKFYDDGRLKFAGQVRKYFPVSDFSTNRTQNQYAYYLFTNYKMAGNVDVFNQLTPRYFDQAFYKTGDSISFVEDYTTIAKAMNSWFKYGIGQHSQMEWHKKTDRGDSVEIYPFVDLVLNTNAFIEPRLYLPIYKSNVVYDTPRNATFDNYQAELFAQISL